jgi:hypothetical protein
MNRALRGLWVGGVLRRQGCGASAYLRILGGRAKGSELESASAGAVLEAAQAAAPIEEARDRRELIAKSVCIAVAGRDEETGFQIDEERCAALLTPVPRFTWHRLAKSKHLARGLSSDAAKYECRNN